MSKDWSGDANSIFKQLGATSHSESERESHLVKPLRERGFKGDPVIKWIY